MSPEVFNISISLPYIVSITAKIVSNGLFERRWSVWFMLFQKILLKTLLDWRWWHGNFITGLWAFKIVATSEGSCFDKSSEMKMRCLAGYKVHYCTSEEKKENLSRWQLFIFCRWRENKTLLMKRRLKKSWIKDKFVHLKYFGPLKLEVLFLSDIIIKC